MKALLLGALLMLLSSGCTLMEAHHAAMAYPTDAPARQEERWMESYTIQKEGRCQLQCTRYGSVVKCKEYRC